MELYSINTASIYYPFVEDFHSAFPEKERRLDKDQRENIDDQPLMSCLLISENSVPWVLLRNGILENSSILNILPVWIGGVRGLDRHLWRTFCKSIVEYLSC